MATEILDSGPEYGRSEIDTSAPFESVKEAASRFGGMASWRSIPQKLPLNAPQVGGEIASVVEVEEEAARLEMNLIKKERETLDVLKELEMTKNIVEELKVKLQNEASEISKAIKGDSSVNVAAAPVPEEEKDEGDATANPVGTGGLGLCPSEAPGYILLELKQAKLNLKRTTDDLADIRGTVDTYRKKIEKERASLEKTRQRLSSNTARILCLEDELNETRKRQETVKDVEVQGGSDDPLSISRELQKLSSEAEQFKEVGEAAKSEVQRAMSEIEQTKTRIRTAEIRLIAAKKMKEAAKASEALALAEIKALSRKEKKGSSSAQQKTEDVTITFEEYSTLLSKAREAEQECKDRVADAMLQVDEANVSKTEILKKVEEATEEVKISKKALEEALSRVEAANRGKLAVEEALRTWRSEHGHKRRSIHNDTKFKNPHPTAHRKECRLVDVNGLDLVSNEVKPVLKPTLSIGQILSQKLMLTEEYENGMRTEKIIGKRKISLGQMLSKPSGEPHHAKKCGKENKELPWKRKKFSFSRISLLAAKQSKKKKSSTASSTCRSSSSST